MALIKNIIGAEETKRLFSLQLLSLYDLKDTSYSSHKQVELVIRLNYAYRYANARILEVLAKTTKRIAEDVRWNVEYDKAMALTTKQMIWSAERGELKVRGCE